MKTTTKGFFTPEDIRDTVLFAASPEHALDVIQNLEPDEVTQSRLRDKSWEYAAKRNWDTIARMHDDMYKQILDGVKLNP